MDLNPLLMEHAHLPLQEIVTWSPFSPYFLVANKETLLLVWNFALTPLTFPSIDSYMFQG